MELKLRLDGLTDVTKQFGELTKAIEAYKSLNSGNATASLYMGQFGGVGSMYNFKDDHYMLPGKNVYQDPVGPTPSWQTQKLPAWIQRLHSGKQFGGNPQPWLNGPDDQGQNWSRVAYAGARAFGGSQMAPLFGAAFGAAANPLVALALGAAAAVAGLTALTDAAISAAKSFSDAYWKSGAVQRNSGAIAAIAAAVGLDASAVAGKAGSLPGASAQFLQQLQAMLSIKDDRQAFHMARALGLEDFLSLRDYDKKTQQDILSGRGYERTPEERKEDIKLQKEWNDVMNEWRKVLLEATPLLRLFVASIGAIPRALKAFFDWAADVIGGKGPGSFRPKGEGSPRNKLEESVDKFKNAVDTFSDAVGVFGGTGHARASKAYPPAWAWYGNQQAMMNDARNLGAFTL